MLSGHLLLYSTGGKVWLSLSLGWCVCVSVVWFRVDFGIGSVWSAFALMVWWSAAGCSTRLYVSLRYVSLRYVSLRYVDLCVDSLC